ncbi:MAG: hypothetical protein QOF78_4638 [Phycisphaerales bacterium]|jgi:uncharacterized protein YndB with AHSA1/START domain|nr:hypothetical protein [Phycisphaerales bacterium]
MSDSTSTADREITATRHFDAPRELVFKMWTEQKHIEQWWGPTSFTTTTYNMDVKPGGVWRFVMHGPDGVDYQNKITYVDVVAPEKLVYRHGGDKDVEPVKFEVTVTFADESDGKTRLNMRMLFPSAVAKNFVIEKYGADKGLVETLARLEERLANMGSDSTADKPFVISRTFDAPRELVWKAWTERDRMMQWFGPKGFTMSAITLDLRPGGVCHYCLRGPDGSEMWGKFVYREIVPLQRIVHVHSFADAKGNVTHHPMSPTWPLEMLSTTTFTEQAGKTTVTIEWAMMNPSQAERDTFNANRDGMNQGWSGTFEQLAAYLAKAKQEKR